MCVAIELDLPLHTQMDYFRHLSVQIGPAMSEEKNQNYHAYVTILLSCYFSGITIVSFSIILHLKNNQGVLAAGSRTIMTRSITRSFHVLTFHDVNK